MQYQQVYTEQTNKSLMGVMGHNLQKGAIEAREKETLDSSTKKSENSTISNKKGGYLEILH